MLTVEEAVTVADQLKSAFSDVFVDASRAAPLVVARDSSSWPKPKRCQHTKTRLARNVYAVVLNGIEFGDPQRSESRKYESIRTCCRCDIVLEATPALF